MPVTLSVVSSRFVGLPAIFQSFGSLSFTSFGCSSLPAASATLPNVVLRPDGACVMTLADALHSDTGTFHCSAAAWISISRAAAPPLRTYSCDSRMPRLPPVPKSPHGRLRATLWPGVGYSVVTFDQSHSNSSATSWARPVSVPWPISERAIRMTTVSSGLITTHAVTSGEPSAARTTAGPNGTRNPSARPPPTAAELMRKERRVNFGMDVMAASSSLGGHVDRFAHLLEGAAATDVRDGRIDVGVGRIRLLVEQRRNRHDHARLAIPALRHIVIDPRLLHFVELRA